MPTGRCKLCLREDQDFKESHLMPAGVYRRIRSEEKNPHPIMITDWFVDGCSFVSYEAGEEANSDRIS
jgi:hypothetical protein